MGVEVANVSGEYADYAPDGILGLGFRSLNGGQYCDGSLVRKDVDLS